MNNEEKILELLERLTEKVDKQSEVLASHSERLVSHDEQLAKLNELLASQDERLAKIEELLAKHDGRLDKIDGRLDKIDELLVRHSELLEELDGRSLRSAVMIENEVLPKLQLLYEGQVHLQETLAPKERVEVLEDEVITLKSTIKMMMKRLDALEKAQ